MVWVGEFPKSAVFVREILDPPLYVFVVGRIVSDSDNKVITTDRLSVQYGFIIRGLSW